MKTKLKRRIIIITISFFISLFFLSSTYLRINANSEVYLPIIMYHNITTINGMAGKYNVLKDRFENDLKYLKENGYTTITTQDLYDYVNGDNNLPKKPIMLTFDDGYESFYVYALPLLEQYEMSAVVSIIGSYTDEYSKTDDHNVEYSHLNWEQVKELSQSPYVEIGNHTDDMHKTGGERKGCHIASYESFDEYKKAFSSDLGSLQNKIQDNTNKSTFVFAYPFGCICDEAKEVLKSSGFKMCFSCYEQVNILTSDSEELYSLGRFNRANGETSEAFFARVLKEIN